MRMMGVKSVAQNECDSVLVYGDDGVYGCMSACASACCMPSS